mmetsp:Transcript_116868/g.183804  ORF Transcript_116868/g.183804 Transcript_116868/m.183804 type:complete len:232 (-) Transcript_116868:471-1166(-)
MVRLAGWRFSRHHLHRANDDSLWTKGCVPHRAHSRRHDNSANDAELSGGNAEDFRRSASCQRTAFSAERGLHPLHADVRRHSVPHYPRYLPRKREAQCIGGNSRRCRDALVFQPGSSTNYREGQCILLVADCPQLQYRWRIFLFLHRWAYTISRGTTLLDGVFHVRLGRDWFFMFPRWYPILSEVYEGLELPEASVGHEYHGFAAQPVRRDNIEPLKCASRRSRYGIRARF